MAPNRGTLTLDADSGLGLGAVKLCNIRRPVQADDSDPFAIGPAIHGGATTVGITKITTGDKELLLTETFVALGLGETAIVIDDDSGGRPKSIQFILNFVETDDAKGNIDWEIVNATTLKVTLANWNSPLGATLMAPVEVGIHEGRQLFLLFTIRKTGEKGQLREVTFSLYLGKAVQ